MTHVDTKGLDLTKWEEEGSVRDWLRGFYEDFKGNLGPEGWCISICTGGEVVGSSLAYYGGKALEAISQNPELKDIGENLANYSNGWGIPFALVAGGTYVYNHVKKDAERQGVKPSPLEIAYWAGTTESFCIATAVGFEYAAMQTFGNPLAGPLELGNLGIEIAAFLSAFPPATAAMSTLTYPKKSEVSRIVSDKNLLGEIENNLGRDYETSDNTRKSNLLKKLGISIDSSINIHGSQVNLTIKERELPQIYHDGFDPKKNSLYSVWVPGAKYSKEARKSAEGFACSTFNEVGNFHEHVENPFAHDHSHEHSH